MDNNLKIAIDILPDRMRQILTYRFGLETGNQKSIEKTAENFGLENWQARHEILRALSILQNPENLYKTEYTKLRDFNKNEYMLVQPVNSAGQVLLKKVKQEWQIVAGKAKPSRTGQLWVFDQNNPDYPDYFVIA